MYRSTYSHSSKPTENYNKSNESFIKNTNTINQECSKPSTDYKDTPSTSASKTGPLDFLKSFAMDDIILIAIIFILLSDDDSDKTLLAILAFLFLSGF